jgi:hypothetical protein
MGKIENLNESELAELWQQLQPLTQKEAKYSSGTGKRAKRSGEGTEDSVGGVVGDPLQ